MVTKNISPHIRCYLIAVALVIVAFVGGLYFGMGSLFSPARTLCLAPTASGAVVAQPKCDSTDTAHKKGYDEALDFAQKRLVQMGMLDTKATTNFFLAKTEQEAKKELAGESPKEPIQASVGTASSIDASVSSIDNSAVIVEFKTSESSKEPVQMELTLDLVKGLSLKVGDKVRISMEAQPDTPGAFKISKVERVSK